MGDTKKINNNRATAREWTAAQATWGKGGANAFYRCQIVTLDTVVVNTQQLPSPHGGIPTNTVHHYKETIQSNKHTMMKQRTELMTHR